MGLASVVACAALVVTILPAQARPGGPVEETETDEMVVAVVGASATPSLQRPGHAPRAPAIATRQRPAQTARPPRAPRVQAAAVAPVPSARPAALAAPVVAAAPAAPVTAAAVPVVEAAPAVGAMPTPPAADPATPIPSAPRAAPGPVIAQRQARARPAAAPVPPAGMQCPPGEARTRSLSIDDGRGVRRAEWADAECSIEIRIEGDVEFNEDFTGFASISPGGLVRITERGDGVDRLLEIRPGAAGELAYRYRLSGRDAPFDDDARAWLRALVPEFLRSSGIAAAERAQWLLRTQGVDGLLAEVTRLRGDRAQRLYLDALLEAGPHPSGTLVRALDVAGSELKSDRELRLLLERIETRDLESPQVRRSFLRATTTIESDRELASVLVGLMEREPLSTSEVELVLESAESIGSDRELAGVLLRVLEESPVEGPLRDRFMSAMETLDSDREYGRVASALLRAGSGG